MSKADMIEVEGRVLEALPGAVFRVELDTGMVIRCHISGRLRKNNIRITIEDTVTVELSPYDLTQGRITYRGRKDD